MLDAFKECTWQPSKPSSFIFIFLVCTILIPTFLYIPFLSLVLCSFTVDFWYVVNPSLSLIFIVLDAFKEAVLYVLFFNLVLCIFKRVCWEWFGLPPSNPFSGFILAQSLDSTILLSLLNLKAICLTLVLLYTP